MILLPTLPMNLSGQGLAAGQLGRDAMDAIKAKGKTWNEMVEEMHGGFCSEPVVGGNFFSVAMGMDVTMKGQPRMKLDEIAVFEVKEGKIVKEQFFF